MQFSKVIVKAGRVLDSVTIDSDELDNNRISECTTILIRLQSIVEDNLRIVAAERSKEIKNLLQSDYSAALSLPSIGNALSISLGTKSVAIDNPSYKESSDLHFSVLGHGHIKIANLIVPCWLPENSARARCTGKIAGSYLRDFSDEGLATFMGDVEAQLQHQAYTKECVDQIIAARPGVVTEIIDPLRFSDLQELAVSVSDHFAATMLLSRPYQ